MAQKTLAEDFFATSDTDFDPAFWNRFLAAVTARFAGLDGIRVSWESLSQDVLDVVLTRINDVLGPASQRIQNIADLGFLSLESRSERTLAPGLISFTPEPGAQLELFVPTPFVAITRQGSPADFGIGRVVYFNRADRILDIEVSYFEGDPGPHSDWTIAAVAGQALAQNTIMNRTFAVRYEVEQDRIAAQTARGGAEAARTGAETAHNQAVEVFNEFREAVAPSGAEPPPEPFLGQFWYDGEVVRVFDGVEFRRAVADVTDYYTKSEVDADKVAKSGDTMTGSLTIDATNATLKLSGDNRQWYWQATENGSAPVFRLVDDTAAADIMRIGTDGAIWTAQIGDVNARIENRALAFANDRVANLAIRRTSRGEIGINTTRAVRDTPAGCVMTGLNLDSNYTVGIRYDYLQLYDPVRGWVTMQG